VGLPGSGKSTVGALIAERLGRTFLDFDLEIARREGMSVSDIFGQRGEQYFRDREHALTEELCALGNMVLAPGGGWMTRAETVALLRPPARLIYLQVTPASAMRRMGAMADGRPLLRHPDPVGELERLLLVRRAAYESADLVVDVERITPQQVGTLVTEWLATQAG
jgi:shikimate kinase